jgi:hypothetical protein
VLPKTDLRHVKLQGADLRGANLQGVVGWDATNLQGAILGGTKLQSAGLIGADLQGADLRGANLQGANLSWAKLQGADLPGANLQGANLSHADLQGADLNGANLQGADLTGVKLQGADLTTAKLQGSDLTSAELQGAKLSKIEQRGVVWSKANLDGLFITESVLPDWNEHQKRKLQSTLKLILTNEKFSAFQTRMSADNAGLPSGKPVSRIGCYSDDPGLLECEYRDLSVMGVYRTGVLHPKLIGLACSNRAIALGIASRASNKSMNNDPDFGLAAALLNALESPNPCVGLSVLSEQTRQTLQETAKQQNNPMPQM